MSNRCSGLVLPQFRTLFGRGTLVGLSEVLLLDRFVAHRDEAAFEAIVSRHGPMVLGVCRRVLDDPADIEDAFQATFLVLVRRSGSLRNPELLANWLYGVAHRVSVRAAPTPFAGVCTSGRGVRNSPCRMSLAKIGRSCGLCSTTSCHGFRIGSAQSSSFATWRARRRRSPRGNSAARWARSRAGSVVLETASAAASCVEASRRRVCPSDRGLPWKRPRQLFRPS